MTVQFNDGPSKKWLENNIAAARSFVASINRATLAYREFADAFRKYNKRYDVIRRNRDFLRKGGRRRRR